MSDYNQPPQQQPNYPQQQPYGQGYPAAAEDPGKTLGIVGLVLAIIGSVIGLIISIVAYRKSKKAGFKNTPAFAGIIVGIITTIGTIIVTILLVIGLAAAGSIVQDVQRACAGQPSGTQVRVQGTTVACP